MSSIKLTLLGGFKLLSPEGEEIAISVNKAKALLAYLALNQGQPVSRDRLSALLWEESSDAQARHSLRQALADLRKNMDHYNNGILNSDSATITIEKGRIDVDVFQFESLAKEGSPDALGNAAQLYQGELLEGFNARSDAFDEWLMARRSACREMAGHVFSRLLPHFENDGPIERAIQTAIRMLSIDPLQESVHRTLMSLYARQGRYGSALKQYKQCGALLRRELGVKPESETEKLCQTLLKQRQSMPSEDGQEGESISPFAEVERAPSTVNHDIYKNELREAPISSPELRQVTIITLMLSDYSELCAHGDPEAFHEGLVRFSKEAGSLAAGYGAYILDGMGERVTALFGIPSAHSDDTVRALNGAISLRERLKDKVRIGMASGRVMVEKKEDRFLLSGEALISSGRLAELAGKGEIIISSSVRHSLTNLLMAEPLEAKVGTGRAWRLCGVTPSGKRGALVGRKREVRLFTAAMKDCRESGCGESFLLRGEAGIGKSRLLEEMERLAASEGFACHKTTNLDFGSAFIEGAIPLLVRSLLHIHVESDDEFTGIESLSIPHEMTSGPEESACLTELLALPLNDKSQKVLQSMNVSARRERTQRLLSRIIENESCRVPLIIIVEDIHWAEREVLNDLALIASLVAGCPALLVMTSRIEGEPLDPTWRSAMAGAPLLTIDLPPLREDEAILLAKGFSLDDKELMNSCLKRAGGNPLFLEQLLRTAAEGERRLPDSIQSIVWARLDQLPVEEKRAVQAASVLGQRVGMSALRFLIDEKDFNCELLLERQFLKPQGDLYIFSHALIQEGIYRSILKSRRLALHRRAAKWFEERDPVLYAEHLDRAEDAAASEACLKSAQWLKGNFHFEDALGLVDRGLALSDTNILKYRLLTLKGELLYGLGRITESIKTYEESLNYEADKMDRCRTLVSMASCWNRQDAYDKALNILKEAQSLAESEGCKETLATLHYQRGNIYFPLGKLDGCLLEHEKARQYALEAGSSLLEANALSGLGDAYYQRGQMVTAYDYFNQCVVLCRENDFSHIQVANEAMCGLLLFFQNRSEEGLEILNTALDLSRQVADRRGEMIVLAVLAQLYCYRACWDEVNKACNKGLELARSLGSIRMETDFLSFGALALHEEGHSREALENVEKAFTLCKDSIVTYSGPVILGTWALVTNDEKKREWALKEGETILKERDCVSHNYLVFYQYALQVSLINEKWEEARRYAAALEEYTKDEALPWSDFYISLTDLLSAKGGGEDGPEIIDSLLKLTEKAEKFHIDMALPLLQKSS